MSAEVETAIAGPSLEEDGMSQDLNGAASSGDDEDLFGDDDGQPSENHEYESASTLPMACS